MQNPYFYDFDYAASVLCTFDISGTLLFQDSSEQSKKIKNDYEQLMNDHDVLEKDYKSAVEKVLKDNANDHI